MKSAKLTALIAVITVSIAALQLTGCVHHSRAAASDSHKTKEQKDGNGDLAVKENIDQTYQLSPGAQVEVSGLNGSLDITTSDTTTAEVHIVRSARTQETLNERKSIIEQSADRLVIRSERGRNRGVWDLLKGGGETLRTRVTLRLPRKVKLEVSGVNGHVTVGEIDDAVDISGVNGRVTIAQAIGATSFSGINGSIEVTIKDLGKKGIELSGINGPIEMRFANEINADLDVSGLNGGFNDKGMNIVMPDKHDRRNFSAKIGSGGAPINISGVNGAVTFEKTAQSAKTASSANSAATK